MIQIVKECNAKDFFNGIRIINNKDSTLKDVIDGKKPELITVQENDIFALTASDNQIILS